MQLRLGGQRIWRAMQVDAVFAQRFTVIRHIQHGAVMVSLRIEKFDQVVKHAVGVQHSVVVGIDDFFPAASISRIPGMA